jgi:sulfonate transport system permease protein
MSGRGRVNVGSTGASSAPPLRGLLPLAIGLLAWQFLGPRNVPYFPPPLEWLKAVDALRASGNLWPAVLTTMTSFSEALVLSIVIGSALGILLGRSASFDRMLGPSLEFWRTMPAGALVPVAVLILGYTESMTLFVVMLTSVWPILLNVRTAARRISQDRLDTARVLHMSWFATQRKILIPSLVGSIQLGTQIAAPIVLIIVLLVEILTQGSGIGREISLAQSTFRSSTVFGLVILTGVLGLAVNLLIGWTRALLRNYEANV